MSRQREASPTKVRIPTIMLDNEYFHVGDVEWLLSISRLSTAGHAAAPR